MFIPLKQYPIFTGLFLFLVIVLIFISVVIELESSSRIYLADLKEEPQRFLAAIRKKNYLRASTAHSPKFDVTDPTESLFIVEIDKRTLESKLISTFSRTMPRTGQYFFLAPEFTLIEETRFVWHGNGYSKQYEREGSSWVGYLLGYAYCGKCSDFIFSRQRNWAALVPDRQLKSGSIIVFQTNRDVVEHSKVYLENTRTPEMPLKISQIFVSSEGNSLLLVEAGPSSDNRDGKANDVYRVSVGDQVSEMSKIGAIASDNSVVDVRFDRENMDLLLQGKQSNALRIARLGEQPSEIELTWPNGEQSQFDGIDVRTWWNPEKNQFRIFSIMSDDNKVMLRVEVYGYDRHGSVSSISKELIDVADLVDVP